MFESTLNETRLIVTVHMTEMFRGQRDKHVGIPQACTSCGTNDGTIGDVIRTSRMQPQKGSAVSVPSREELQAGKAQERCPNSTLCQSTLKFFPGSTGCGHSPLL